MSSCLIPILTAVFTLLAKIYVTVRIDWSLRLIAVAACPVLFFTKYFRKRLRRQWKDVKELESSVMGIIQEVLASLRVVKAFCRESWEEERFKHRAHQGVRAKLRAVTSEGFFSLLLGIEHGRLVSTQVC